MPPAGFEPTISAGERPQTYALDRAATGTGKIVLLGRTNNEIGKRLSFITRARTTRRTSLDDLHRHSCVEHSWYGMFYLLMLQNAINADYGNASLTGTLPYGLTWTGDCVKACSTVATFLL